VKYTLVLLSFLFSGLVLADDGYGWVQFNSSGKLELRYVANGDDLCPKAKLDGRVIQMHQRTEIDSSFPGRICQSESFDSVNSIEIEQTKIQFSTQKTNKILIIGDTGCAESFHGQKCTSHQDWPLEKIVETIKNKENYDYAIHLGDFHYNPTDFGYDDWRKEFFDPIRPIISKSPWIFVRGNHEDCRRAYKGWSKLLDPFPSQDSCVKFSPLYEVTLGKYEFIVMDNSTSYDLYKDAKTDYEEALLIQRYAQEFEKAKNMIKAANDKGLKSLLLMHKPIFGVDQENGKEQLYNVTMESSAQPRYIDYAELVISGHVHAWEAFSLKNSAMPPQIIVGNSGNALISDKVSRFESMGEIAKALGVSIDQFYGEIKFGYAMLSLFDDKLMIEFKDVEGVVSKTCVVQNSKLSCN
jgi:predicted phosphodiesterase